MLVEVALPLPLFRTFTYEVDDAEATVPWLKKCGARIVDGPKPRPDGYVQVFVEDPDGHIVELCSMPKKDSGIPKT